MLCRAILADCALDYGNVFDTFKPMAQGHVSFERMIDPDGGDIDVYSVAGFMLDTAGTCGSDHCKEMMAKVYKFFADTMIVGGRAGQSPNCSATAVASCSAAAVATATSPPPPSPSTGNATANTTANGGSPAYADDDDDDGCGDNCWYDQSACAAPAQTNWLGDVSSDANIQSTEAWATLYWALCMFESYCPALGVSAYEVTTTLTMGDASDVDTPEEQQALKEDFVDTMNDELGMEGLSADDVTLSVEGAEVTFTYSTQSAVVRSQSEEVLSESGTEIAGQLGGTSFTPASVAPQTFPPPPPAPGYTEEGAGQAKVSGSGSNQKSGDGDDNMPLMVGAAAGGVLALICVCLGAFACMRRSQDQAVKNKKKASTHQWQAGGGGAQSGGATYKKDADFKEHL